ncbi:MAG: glycosyltransferase family 2 protein [Planctomycetes bacterium]|nr:glycosyltransferase family 2 protein [Planctomycetota bacterium]
MALPSLSVVIASGAGGEFLFRLLDALREQAQAEQAQVLVADRVGGATAARLDRDYPWVRRIAVAPGADGRKPSVPLLRATAVAQATGDVVAVMEEHCRPTPHWLRAVREEWRADDAAIGGPILHDAYENRCDWVVLFSEYQAYLPPWRDGERWLLNGANIAYRRTLLQKHAGRLTTGYWEAVLHPLLPADGKLRGLNRLGNPTTGPFEYPYYLRQRYLLARVWGAMQRQSGSALKRLIYLLAAPLFPFLWLARTSARALRTPYKGQYLLTLPMLLPVAFVYVFGEWCGYAFGFGNALEEVE